MITNPRTLEQFDAEYLAKIKPRVSNHMIRKFLPKVKHRTKHAGDWPFNPKGLMVDLVSNNISMKDSKFQATFLDWMETPDYNKFLNKESGEFVYAQVAKRGNVPYVIRKSDKMKSLSDAIEGKIFDHPLPGFRDRRMTRLLLITLTFDQKQFTPEKAWASLRSKPIEGVETSYNLLNKLNANISKIFGKHGTLISKEAQSNGYPAPHIIVVLDKPVMVKRHIGKDGYVSWRLCDPCILNRIGKGDLMRKLYRDNPRSAISKNPIWKNGFIDFEGVVSEEGSKSGRDATRYTFKYLVKSVTEDGAFCIKDCNDISSVDNKSLRTMLFTHLGNKCFRTRDVSFGKGFKECIGMLPEAPKVSSDSVWKRIRTVNQFEYNWIQAYNQAVSTVKPANPLQKEAIT